MGEAGGKKQCVSCIGAGQLVEGKSKEKGEEQRRGARAEEGEGRGGRDEEEGGGAGREGKKEGRRRREREGGVGHLSIPSSASLSPPPLVGRSSTLLPNESLYTHEWQTPTCPCPPSVLHPSCALPLLTPPALALHPTLRNTPLSPS